ncbi:MAG: M20/M25/M40 family metallo-hydrolase [Patescibacteria group bacterium]
MNKNLINKFKENLGGIIKYKSISTDKAYKQEMKKTVEALETLFKRNGFKTQVLKGKTTNPYVYAGLNIDKNKKTILIYGHYDEMPVGDTNKWVGDPFKLTEKNGRLYGRGVIDNKGQFLIHFTAVTELAKNNNLKYNVKFLLEGNEETGNTEIAEVIRVNRKLLSCDFVLISDGETTANRPTIEAGFRGGSNVTLGFKTAKGDVHSGLYGGAIPNAAHELSILISKFYDKNNKVAIPGFYEGLDKPTKSELLNNKSLKFSSLKLKELTGIKSLKCEKGIDFFTQTGLRPMLTVSGMKSGYTDEGYNNIVPCYAETKINFRFAASQDPRKILSDFKKFVMRNKPSYVSCEINVSSSWPALKMATKTKLVENIKKILEEVYKEKVAFRFVGGSIPVIGFFKSILKTQVVSIPLANEDCNMHGTNENFKLKLVEKALEFSTSFFAR